MARVSICTKTVREDMSGVDFTFSNGEVLSVDISSIPDEVIAHLICHGISQKVGDSYTGQKDAAEAHATASALVERLQGGEWTAARQSSGGGAGRVTQLAEALARACGKTVPECVAVLDGMDDDQKKQLRQHDAIKAQLAIIKAEAAQAAAAKAQESLADAPSLDSMFG